MPTLYHRAPVGHSAKTLITLEEKGIAYRSRHVNVPFERVPEIMECIFSQSASLPVFVDDDGTTLAESSVIGEYLDETRSAVPLMPLEPVARWRARVWFKAVNEDFAPAVALLAWEHWGRPSRSTDELAQIRVAIAELKAPDRISYWQEALAGYSTPRLSQAKQKIRDFVTLMERRLQQSPYLADREFSLADIDVWPFAEPLPRLLPDLVSRGSVPRIHEWIDRIRSRPSVTVVTKDARDVDWIPGPEPIRWG